MLFIIEDKFYRTVLLDEYSKNEIYTNRNLPYMMRLKHNCENCNSEPEYNLYGQQYVVKLMMIPMAKHLKEYFVECIKCKTVTLLDYSEYRSLKKISKQRKSIINNT